MTVEVEDFCFFHPAADDTSGEEGASAEYDVDHEHSDPLFEWRIDGDQWFDGGGESAGEFEAEQERNDPREL